MKTNALVLAFCCLFFIESTHAQVLWYGDPNLNYLESFYRLSREPGEVGTVNTTTDPVYGKVWVLNKPVGDKRCEFARTEGKTNSYTPKEGDMLYVGWRMKSTIVGNNNPGFAVFQWKSDPPEQQNYPFSIVYNGNKITLDAYDVRKPGSTCQSCVREVVIEKDLPENTWMSIVIGVKVSRDEKIGYLEVWINGVQQDLPGGSKRFMHRTLDDSGNYLKWGAYGGGAIPYDVSTYLDEMRLGTTYASVATPLGYVTTPVNKLPTVAITSPANNAVFEVGETITLSATASDSDGSIDRVNFKLDDGYFSNDRTAPYTGAFTPTTAGTYKIAAKAFDDKDESTEVFVTITVKEGKITSVEDQEMASLSIYPNPSKSGLFQLQKEVAWEVFSAEGQLLKSGVNTSIDLTNEATGMYFVKCNNTIYSLLIQK